MRVRRAGIALCALIVASLWLATDASAQIVRGRVLERDSTTPARGVIVALLDSAKASIVRTISRESGYFAIRAPAPGRYRLQILRVGFKSMTTSEFMIPADSIVDRQVIFTGEPVSLQTVHVVEGELCRVAKDASAAAYDLWEEIRKALTTTTLAQREGLVQMQLRSYDGEVARTDSVPFIHRITDREGLFDRSFSSIPVDSLSKFGYIRAQRSGRGKMATLAAEAFGPDENVLLSEAFAGSHCLKVVADAREPQLIGLWFSPVKEVKNYSDIEGTLWVNRATAELRYLEYRYTNPPKGGDWAGAGGRVNFMQMSNGMWVIPDWQIRLPAPGSGNALHVSGGVLSELRGAPPDTDVVVWMRPTFTASGTVIDTSTKRPLAGAVVRMSSQTVFTDENGHFDLYYDIPGQYNMFAGVPLFDSVGVAAHDMLRVTLTGAPQELTLRAISEENFLAQRCRDRWNRDSAGVFVGYVVTGTAEGPIRGARVAAVWPDTGSVADSLAAQSLSIDRGKAKTQPVAPGAPHIIETRTMPGGQYILCGVPRNVPIVVFAERIGKRSELFRGKLGSELYVNRRFVIPPDGAQAR